MIISLFKGIVFLGIMVCYSMSVWRGINEYFRKELNAYISDEMKNNHRQILPSYSLDQVLLQQKDTPAAPVARTRTDDGIFPKYLPNSECLAITSQTEHGEGNSNPDFSCIETQKTRLISDGILNVANIEMIPNKNQVHLIVASNDPVQRVCPRKNSKTFGIEEMATTCSLV